MTDDFAFLDATAQAELVRTGQVSALELVDAAINRVEKLNPELNAVIHPLFDQARRRASGPLPDGPFTGVPTLFKDLGCAIEGEPYHEGMQFLKDAGYRSPHTDNLAQQYFAAGLRPRRADQHARARVWCRRPSRSRTARRTTRGSSAGRPVVRRAARPPPWPVAWCRSPTRTTAAGRSASPPRAAGSSGSSRHAGGHRLGPDLNDISQFLIVELCVSRTVRDTAGVLDAVQRPVPR